MASQSKVDWSIGESEKSKYMRIFKNFDKEGTGLHILDEDMQDIMAKTNQPKEVCAKVWDLVNPEGEEYFTVNMFLMTIHLLYKSKVGISIPDVLP